MSAADPPPSASCARQPSSRSARLESRQLRCSSPGRRSANCGSTSDAGGRLEHVPQREHVGLHAGGHVERAALAVGGDQRATDIPDVHIVARRLAMPEHLRCLARMQVVGEDRDHAGLAVRALARAVDIAQPTHRVGHAGRQRPSVDVGLGRPLRRAVGGQGRGDALLGGRQGRLVAVERPTGRGERHGCAEPAGGVHHVERALHVDGAVAAWIGNRCRHRGLRGEVVDGARLHLLEDAL